MRFFDGRQPRLTHVPPTVRCSIMTAVLPSSWAVNAAANAVEPEPRIRKSTGAFIRCSTEKKLWCNEAKNKHTPYTYVQGQARSVWEHLRAGTQRLGQSCRELVDNGASGVLLLLVTHREHRS